VRAQGRPEDRTWPRSGSGMRTSFRMVVAPLPLGPNQARSPAAGPSLRRRAPNPASRRRRRDTRRTCCTHGGRPGSGASRPRRRRLPRRSG
jgi:hypothetical protein